MARRREWIGAAVGALVVLGAFNVRLGTPALWGDEADTANFARSILRHGIPHAVLGRNVLAFEDCFQLSDGLLARRLPWGQYYTAAASIALFGDDTAGVRRLFCIVAALAFFPLWWVLRRRVPWAPLFTAIVLLTPQVLLFARQARYYPLVLALSCALLWNLDSGPRSSRTRWAVSIGCLVGLFHVHPLVAAGAGAAACAYAALLDRARWREVAVASVAGGGSWAAWYLSMTPAPSSVASPLRLMRDDPAAWGLRTATGVLSGVRDLDYVGALPLAAWALVLGSAWVRRRRLEEPRPPLRGAVPFAILAVGIQIVAVAAAVGVERGDLAALRYMPHAAVLAPVALLLVAVAGIGRAWGGAAVAAALAVNWGTVGHWTASAALPAQPSSWWLPVYSEVLTPQPDDVGALVATVRAGARRAAQEGPIGVFPPYATDTYVFYLGDAFGIVPYVGEGSACSRLVADAVGPAAWEALLRAPVAIVDQSPVDLGWPGAERVAVPLARTAWDGTRPELTRHEFPGADRAAFATVFVSPAARAAGPSPTAGASAGLATSHPTGSPSATP